MAQVVELFREENPDSIVIYAYNEEFCPVTITLNLSLKNMKSSRGKQKDFVIPAAAVKYHVTTLKPKTRRKGYEFSYDYNMHYGDHTRSTIDHDYEYWLPFERGVTSTIHQGYNGRFSHNNTYALDFAMPIGSKVMAARGGTVIKIVDKHARNCNSKSCAKYNNLIWIYHTDGSIAEYVHLNTNGSLVKPGDIIEKGQHIGYSGNVGWSNGPHLHFGVFEQFMNKKETIKTKIIPSKNIAAGFLKEKVAYTKNY